MAVFGRILLFFSSFVLLKKCPKINFWQENRLLWHLWCFLAFFTCSSSHELVRARTSPKKFCAGLLMHAEGNPYHPCSYYTNTCIKACQVFSRTSSEWTVRPCGQPGQYVWDKIE